MIEGVADLVFEAAQETFTGEIHSDAAFLACRSNEVHYLRELLVAQLKLRVLPRTAHRENGEDAPGAHAQRDKIFLEFREAGEIALVDAGYHVEDEVRLGSHHPDGIRGVLESLGMAAHPGMLFPEAVEADGGSVDAASQQRVEAPAVEQDAVGDDAPGIFAVIERTAHLFEVPAHQWLAACQDDESGMGIDVRGEGVNHTEEVGGRHVVDLGTDAAVAAAMQARRVAAQRTLPEKLTEPMLLDPPVLQFRE